METLLAETPLALGPSHRPTGPTAPGPLAQDPAVPLLLDRLRQELHARHYTARTETAYVEWIHRFLAYFPGRHVTALGEPELRGYLSDLAGRREITPAARNQARAALLLWFHAVLGRRIDCTDGVGHARPDGRTPAVLARPEIRRLLAAIDEAAAPGMAIAAALLYGSGLRPFEVVALRVRDIDLEGQVIHIRDDRGRKADRLAVLPAALVAPLRAHLDAGQRRHERDLARGAGAAPLPEAVRLREAGAARAWGWQWLFGAGRVQVDPLTRQGRRAHLHESVLQRAILAAARAAGLAQPVDSNTLRHCFAVHAVESGWDPAAVQALLGTVHGPCPIQEALARGSRLRSPLDA